MSILIGLSLSQSSQDGAVKSPQHKLLPNMGIYSVLGRRSDRAIKKERREKEEKKGKRKNEKKEEKKEGEVYICKTTIYYDYSSLFPLRMASNRHVEPYYDPTLVWNGYWGQNMDHILGLIKSKMSKITLPLVRLRPSSPSFRALTICSTPLRGMQRHIMIQLWSKTDIGVKTWTTFLVS